MFFSINYSTYPAARGSFSPPSAACPPTSMFVVCCSNNKHSWNNTSLPFLKAATFLIPILLYSMEVPAVYARLVYARASSFTSNTHGQERERHIATLITS
jgi:hypothetical protein